MDTKLFLALPLLAAFAAPRALEEEFAFRPAEGWRLRVLSEQSFEMSLEDQTSLVTNDGEEMDFPQPDVEMTRERSERVVFVDEVLAAADGRVRELRRTYEEVGDEESMEITLDESFSEDKTGTSLLEGVTVVFTWDEDDEEYTVAFGEDDEDGDEDLLEDLECRVDYASFLPGRAVSIGDSWEVDVTVFRDVMSPGGDLQIRDEDEERSEEEDEMSDQLDENLEGSVTCKLADVREEEGSRLAVIEITVEASTEGSQEGELETPVGAGTMENALRVEFDLAGELVWDLVLGRALSLDLEGDLVFTLSQVQEVSAETEIRAETEQVFEGTTEFHVAFEEAE